MSSRSLWRLQPTSTIHWRSCRSWWCPRCPDPWRPLCSSSLIKLAASLSALLCLLEEACFAAIEMETKGGQRHGFCLCSVPAQKLNESGDPPELRAQVSQVFDEWIRVSDEDPNDHAHASFVGRLQQMGFLKVRNLRGMLPGQPIPPTPMLTAFGCRATM